MEKKPEAKNLVTLSLPAMGGGGQPVFAASGCLFKRHCDKFLLTVMYEVRIENLKSHLLRSTDGMRQKGVLQMSFVI
jgi:hypothetical protein